MKLARQIFILLAVAGATQVNADSVFAKPTVPLFKNTYDIVSRNCVLNLQLQNQKRLAKLNVISILGLPQGSTLTPAVFPLSLQPGFNSNLLVSLPAIPNGLQLTLNYTLSNSTALSNGTLSSNPSALVQHPITLTVSQSGNTCTLNNILPVQNGFGVNAPANVVLFNNTLAFK